jgi:hypothetical protein
MWGTEGPIKGPRCNEPVRQSTSTSTRNTNTGQRTTEYDTGESQHAFDGTRHCLHVFFFSHTVHLDTTKVFYLPTDAQ